MAEAVILEFSGIGKAEYLAVNEHLDVDMMTGEGDWPDGLQYHAAGNADDGPFVVFEVWESRAAQAAFLENRLGAALGATGVMSAPKVTWVPLYAQQLRST